MRTTLLLPLLLLAGCDGPAAAGVRAYEAGRYRDALEAFTAAEQQAGHGAPAALVHNRALAALRAGELQVAELSAEKAAVRGGAPFFPLRDFLLGNAAWARCLRAEAEAGLRDPDPTALPRAIAHARQAGEHWQAAAMSRTDWPEARRNVERAARKLEELERALREAEERAAKRAGRTEAQPAPDPAQPPADRPREEVDQEPVAQQPDAPARDLIERLQARLQELEREKRALRQARQQARGAAVERDW